MKKLLVILLFALPVFAQSPFAVRNLGVDVSSADARTDARAWGLADYDTLTPSFHNLASLAGLRAVAVSVSDYALYSKSEDASQERESYRVITPSLRFGVPFKNGKIVLSAGFKSSRSTHYDSQSDYSVIFDNAIEEDTPDTLSGIAYFRRDGTQFTIPLGMSFELNESIRLAASINLENGPIRERATISFNDSGDNNQMRATTEIKTDEHSGTSNTFSVLLTPSEKLAFGGSYTTAHKWDIKRVYEMTGVAGEVESDHTWNIPEVWNVGASYAFKPRWRVGVEFENKPMTSFTGDSVYEQQMTDGWVVGAGIERLPASKRRGGFSNFPLRLGFKQQKWSYTVNNEDIMENRVSVGTGFPFKSNNGYLDFALSYGWVGDMEDHGVEDRYMRMTVSVTGLEKWW
jgi:hypothetical protein